MSKNKNNSIFYINQKSRFSLRKLTIGLASVLLGTSLYLANPTTQTVKADTINDKPKDSEINIVNGSDQRVANASINASKDTDLTGATVAQGANQTDGNQANKPVDTASSANLPVTNDKHKPDQNASSDNANNLDTNHEQNTSATDTTGNSNNNHNNPNTNPTNTTQNPSNSDSSVNLDSNNTINQDTTEKTKPNTVKNTEKPETKAESVYGYLSKDEFIWDAATGTLTVQPKNGSVTIENTAILFGAGTRNFLPGIDISNDVKHIKIVGHIKLIGSARSLFMGCMSATSIDGLNNIDFTDVTSMDSMFEFDYVLANLDLSSFNTKNVKNMAEMFDGCKSLVSLDLSSFDTTQVTDMSSMFNDCYGLETLNLSSFNTSNVINMSHMFDHCGLESLDISNFDMRSVKNMSSMFSWMYHLKSIKVPKTTTDSAENMSNLFTNTALQTIDLSWLNTTHVTDMTAMFSTNRYLMNLDLSNLDMSAVTSTKDMLEDLRNLRYIKLGNKNNLRDTGLDTYGTWLNVGTGTLHAPQGSVNWSSSELMQNYDPSKNADTYVRSMQVIIRYIDIQNNSQPIPGITPIVYHTLCTDLAPDNVISSYFPVSVTPEMVATKNAVLQKNYELVTDPFENGSINLNLAEPYINYTFSHKTIHEVEKITHKLIVHYVDENGQALQADSITSKEFSRDRYKDLVTNEYTNHSWDSTDTTVTLPVIKGYITDKATVSTANVTNDKDDEITQVYQKLGNFIPVDKHSNPIAGTQKIQYTNDPKDPTKVLATVPTISGHVAVNKEQMPPDPTKDMYVTYLENNKTVIGFIDQDDNNQMIAGIDNIISSTEIGKTIEKPTSLDQVLTNLKNKGYELVTDPLAQPVTATDGEQKLNYVFKHQKDSNQIDTLIKTQTIHFVDNKGNKLADDKVTEVTFTRNGTKDVVTGITEWGNWSPEQTLPEVKVPVVNGYIANHAIVVSQKITATDDNVETTITYQKLGQYVPVDKNGKVISATANKTYENDPDDPTKIKTNQTLPTIDGYTPSESAKTPEDVTKDTNVLYLTNNKTIIGFVDQDNDNQLIHDAITTSNEIGKPITKPADLDKVIADAIAELQDKGYELVSDPFAKPVTTAEGEQKLNYVFKHKQDNTLTDTVNRKQIIHFVDANGNKLADDKVTEAKFTRTGVKDLATGKITWADWSKAQTLAEVKLPVIKGYITNKAILASQTITANKDVETNIIYQKLGNYVPVDKNGKGISGQDKIPYENDLNDPTKIVANQKLPDIKGYITSKTPTPKDLTKDTNVIYELISVDTGTVINGNSDKPQTDKEPNSPESPTQPTKPNTSTTPTKPNNTVKKQKKSKSRHKLNNNVKQTIINLLHSKKHTALADDKAKSLKQKQDLLPQTGIDPKEHYSVFALIALGVVLIGISVTEKLKKRQ